MRRQGISLQQMDLNQFNDNLLATANYREVRICQNCRFFKNHEFSGRMFCNGIGLDIQLKTALNVCDEHKFETE